MARLKILLRAGLLVLPWAAVGVDAGPPVDIAAAANRTGLEVLRMAASANTALAPYSLERGTAMVLAGASGETRSQMAQVLHLPADDDSGVASAFAATAEGLSQATREAGAEWHSADRLFGQSGYPFHAEFLDRLRRDYGAPFEPCDFRQHYDAARERINRWAADVTAGRIPRAIPEGGVNDRTRLALVDALYLKIDWEERFRSRETTDRPFAGTRAVSTMHRIGWMGYAKLGDFTAVTVPYASPHLQLLLLLPDASDGLAAMKRRLTADQLRRCAQAPERYVSLYLPQFHLEPVPQSLGATLRALGMPAAFDQPRGSADFSRMAPRRPDDYLALSEVFQSIYLDVNETGTEAAAVTGGVVLSTFAVRQSPPNPIVVDVNHPFLFAIQHRPTGLCLFLGTIGQPGSR